MVENIHNLWYIPWRNRRQSTNILWSMLRRGMPPSPPSPHRPNLPLSGVTVAGRAHLSVGGLQEKYSDQRLQGAPITVLPEGARQRGVNGDMDAYCSAQFVCGYNQNHARLSTESGIHLVVKRSTIRDMIHLPRDKPLFCKKKRSLAPKAIISARTYNIHNTTQHKNYCTKYTRNTTSSQSISRSSKQEKHLQPFRRYNRRRTAPPSPAHNRRLASKPVALIATTNTAGAVATVAVRGQTPDRRRFHVHRWRAQVRAHGRQ